MKKKVNNCTFQTICDKVFMVLIYRDGKIAEIRIKLEL